MATRTRLRGAAAGDDETAYPALAEHLRGPSVHRFYALRLREAGMIKSTPQRLIAQGTDWRFLNELKKELKG
jgi:hypothetical protein